MRDSLLPLSPADFWLKKWGAGVVVPSLLTLAALYSIVERHSLNIAFFLHHRGSSIPVEIFGRAAVFNGVALIGFSLALVSRCFASYQLRLVPFADAGLALGVILAAVGIWGVNLSDWDLGSWL